MLPIAKPLPPSSLDLSSSIANADNKQTSSRYPQGAAELRTRLLASYVCDVLGLHGEGGEEDVDQQIQAEARALGLDVSHAINNEEIYKREDVGQQGTFSIEASHRRRSQESIVSRSSHSTGFVSNFSDTSRGRHVRDYPTHRTASIASNRSFSIRDYDDRITSPRESITFSPPLTPSRSTFSLALSSSSSSPKRHFRRIRGLSMLKLVRNAPRSSAGETCPHCAPNTTTPRQQLHHLPCGHRFCTPALRQSITSFMDGDAVSIPGCCSQPIPGRLVEAVMTLEEQVSLMERMQWDSASSRTTSFVSERRNSLAFRPGSFVVNKRSSSRESKIDSVVLVAMSASDPVYERDDFKQMRLRQSEDRTRFSKWLDTQHNHLHTQYISARHAMQQHHDSAIDHLIDQQSHAMSDAEDKQVKAEADMRETHEKEKRDNATALKHMEAYCNGMYSSGEPHGRQITDQDRAELTKTQQTRKLMDARHDSAINILRGEQGRRIRLRGMRQEKELQDMQRMHEAEDTNRDFSHTRHMRELDEFAREHHLRMQQRWGLQTAIFLKMLESETGMTTDHIRPEAEWLVEKRLPRLGPLDDRDLG